MTFDLEKAKFVADNGDLMHTTKTLFAAIARIEELEACLIKNKKRWATWMDTTDQQIIDKLREELCEAEAISLHNFRRYEAAIGEGHISGFDHRIGWSDLPEERRKAIIEVHREMLHAEGKL